MQKANPLHKTDSTEKWRCAACEFDNLGLLQICEVCETPRKKVPRKLEQKESIKDKEAGILCPVQKCSHFNSIMSQYCGKCGKSLFPSDVEEDVLASQDRKKQEAALIACLYCKFKNRPESRKCLGCNKRIPAKKIPSKSGRLKSAHFAVGATKPCPTCDEKIRIIDFATGQIDICMNCQQKFPSDIRKSLCIFCDTKLTKQTQLPHELQCKERKKFYQRKDNPTYERCTDLQVETMLYMHKKCEKLHYKKQRDLIKRIQTLGYSEKDLGNLHHYIMHYAPIIIHMHVNTHFHFFVKDTHYRNQFETSVSSGSLSHSARTGWENRMFDKRHHHATGFERVKYGTMNFTNDPSGVRCCAGYGQSYFLLKSHVRDRCTITDMDSSASTATLGTFRFIFHLLLKLSDAQLRSAFEGSKGKQMLSSVISAYKEIQIHGPVQFSEDIQRVYISKDELKLGDAQTLLEQVKTFCSKHKIQYQLFENPAVIGAPFMGHPGTVIHKAPERIVGDKKELTQEDLKPKPPVAPYAGGLVFAGYGGLGGFGAGIGIGAPAPPYALPAPSILGGGFGFYPPALYPKKPQKKAEYGKDYI